MSRSSDTADPDTRDILLSKLMSSKPGGSPVLLIHLSPDVSQLEISFPILAPQQRPPNIPHFVQKLSRYRRLLQLQQKEEKTTLRVSHIEISTPPPSPLPSPQTPVSASPGKSSASTHPCYTCYETCDVPQSSRVSLRSAPRAKTPWHDN